MHPLHVLRPVSYTHLEWLDEADAEKTLLLVLFGVARTQKYITEKKVHELQTKLNEMCIRDRDYAEANGSEEPADDQDAEPAPA